MTENPEICSPKGEKKSHPLCREASEAKATGEGFFSDSLASALGRKDFELMRDMGANGESDIFVGFEAPLVVLASQKDVSVAPEWGELEPNAGAEPSGKRVGVRKPHLGGDAEPSSSGPLKVVKRTRKRGELVGGAAKNER